MIILTPFPGTSHDVLTPYRCEHQRERQRTWAPRESTNVIESQRTWTSRDSSYVTELENQQTWSRANERERVETHRTWPSLRNEVRDLDSYNPRYAVRDLPEKHEQRIHWLNRVLKPDLILWQHVNHYNLKSIGSNYKHVRDAVTHSYLRNIPSVKCLPFA